MNFPDQCDIEAAGKMNNLPANDTYNDAAQTLSSAIGASASDSNADLKADTVSTADNKTTNKRRHVESDFAAETASAPRKRRSGKPRQPDAEPVEEESKKRRKNAKSSGKRGRSEKGDSCDVCGRMFSSDEALLLHKDSEHVGWKEPLDSQAPTPGVKLYPCTQCNNAYKHQSALGVHKSNHSRYPYTCNFCGTGVSRRKTLEQHQAEHTKTFQCDKCGKLFSSSNPLRKHKRDWCRGEANKRYDFHCPVCSYIFSSSAEQKKHIKAEHLNYVSCERCGMDFNDKLEFDKHVCYESTNHKYWCDSCPRRFVSYSKLMNHILPTHNKQEVAESNETNSFVADTARPSPNTYASLLSLVRKNNPKTKKGRYVNPMGYKCNDCPKIFKDRGAFHNHLRFHAKDKSFTCMICSKTLSSRASLFCHTRIHRGERPFICEVCGKKFTEKSKLTRHKRIHTGEKPYICDKCGQSFNQPSSLKTHLRTHDHDNSANFCTVCKKSFRTVTAYEKHKCSQVQEEAPADTVPKHEELDLVAQAALASDALDVLDGDSYDSAPPQELSLVPHIQPPPPPQEEVVQQQVVVTIPSHLSQTVSQTVSQAVWGMVSGAAMGSVAQAFPQYDPQQLTSTLGEFVMQRLTQRLSRMAAEELPRLMTEALEELLP